jgi:hypothetical protein
MATSYLGGRKIIQFRLEIIGSLANASKRFTHSTNAPFGSPSSRWTNGRQDLPRKTAEFVTKLLPQLEAMDLMERHSGFHEGMSVISIATSKHFNSDGSFKVVGESYRSMG